MLSELDAASKAGDTQRAAKLLDQLGEIFENLRGSGQARSSAAARSLSEIDQLSREQQQLRDDTFQGLGQNGGRGGSAERQQALRKRLERALEGLRRSGEGAPADLDDADEAMKEAERALGQGPSGGEQALGAQGREGENGRDPLGRDLGRDGGQSGDSRLGPLGAAPALRAHRLQEELRRRLDQRERPSEELDYLERLLKR